MQIRFFVTLAALLLLINPAWAVKAGDAEFANTWKLGKQTLALNGAGVRGYLGFEVYAAALYLPAAQRDANLILNSAAPKVLHMVYFRDIDRDDALKAWDHWFAENCKSPCTLPAAQIQAFKKLLPEIEEDDTETYVFQGASVEYFHNGQKKGRVEGANFSRLLLSTWIGEVPPTAALKKALLGRR